MKINQALVIIVFTLISTLSLASVVTEDLILNPDTNANKLIGNWRSQRPNLGNGMTFDVQISFRPNRVGLKMNCLFNDGVRLSTIVETFSTYNFTDRYEINIQGYDQSEAVAGNNVCRATLNPSRWYAHFDGLNRLILNAQTPFATQYTLVRY